MLVRRDAAARVHASLVGIALAGLVLYAGTIASGMVLSEAVDILLFHLPIALSGLACLLAAQRRAEMRKTWTAFGVGLIVWALADSYLLLLLDDSAPTFPSLPDAGFLLTLFLFYLGAVYLTRSFDRRASSYGWLDGAIAALGITALAIALIAPAVGSDRGIADSAAAVNFTYPVADLVLLSLVMATMVISGQTGSRTLLTVSSGLVLWAAADTTYLIEVSGGTYDGGAVDLGWLGGAWLIGLASLHAAGPAPAAKPSVGRSFPAIPAISSLLAVTIVVWDHFDPVDVAAIWVAGATLIAATIRLLLNSREIDDLVSRLRHDARTDPLTGLRNRRMLFSDLDRAIADGTRLRIDFTFALFDLNGFKSYNDTFGHPAGDQLLRRLGAQLATVVGPTDGVYRLGGDEFCLLTTDGRDSRAGVIEAARAALTESGEGFTIEASCGIVEIPQEARSSAEAFRIADDRMYAEKGLRANRSERSAHDVLLSALHERDATLSEHLEQVGLLARRTAEELGLPAYDVELIQRAGELHDIGKIAVPDRVLNRPGPLSAEEEELIRRHTIVGQRILSVVPGLDSVGELLRSAHERWDGRGYPDGIAGEAIPLGARIIFVTDAFDAMTSDRPYKSPVDVETALAELRRNAGTQFDPEVVAAFDRTVRRELSIPERSAAVELPVKAERDVMGRLGAS